MSEERTSYGKQLLGSLIAAVLIVIVVVALVTARLGQGGTRERYEEREDLLEERQELREERQELREERREG